MLRLDVVKRRGGTEEEQSADDVHDENGDQVAVFGGEDVNVVALENIVHIAVYSIVVGAWILEDENCRVDHAASQNKQSD